MTKKILYICAIAGAMFLTASCKNDIKMTQNQQAFIQMTEPGVVVNSKYYITYDANKFQTATTGDNIFRLFSDDLTEYASVKINGSYNKVGDNVDAEITYAKGSDGKKVGNYKMTLSKISEDNTYWFWNESNKLGVIVRDVR